MNRVLVVGTTGSGKTTFVRQLAEKLDCPHTELDELHWEADWVQARDGIFRQRAEEARQDACWVMDGNHSAARDILWSRADTIVWLEFFAFRVVLGRLLRRTFGRTFHRCELWNGDRENLWTHFFTRDSLVLWLFRTYWRRKKEYPMLFALPENAHLSIVDLQSVRDADTWIENQANFISEGNATG